MISAKIKNFIIRYDFESKIRTNYIHKLLNNLLDEYVKSNNLMILSKHSFEEGVFIQLNNMKVFGIIPANSESIYTSVSQPFQIKDFTFETNHFIHEILAKKHNFHVEIDDMKYFIEFEKEETMFKKPLNLSITRYQKGKIFILEEKMYYRIRRRLYNNIMNIYKLADGLIKRYQVFNRLDVELLKKYLTDNDILFRIYEQTGSYTKEYEEDRLYRKRYSDCYPEETKIPKNIKVYLEVYKGFVNLMEMKHRSFSKIDYKYSIYLY